MHFLVATKVIILEIKGLRGCFKISYVKLHIATHNFKGIEKDDENN